jgi:hypothetical protein
MKRTNLVFLFLILVGFAFSCKEESTPESISLLKENPNFPRLNQQNLSLFGITITIGATG